jgi:hypothetical protein
MGQEPRIDGKQQVPKQYQRIRLALEDEREV